MSYMSTFKRAFEKTILYKIIHSRIKKLEIFPKMEPNLTIFKSLKWL